MRARLELVALIVAVVLLLSIGLYCIALGVRIQ